MRNFNPSQPSLKFKGRGLKERNQAFTLVELIVVITILAILGTIAFISLQGYSRDARDSKRTSDINNLKTSLELFNVNTGKYPAPDSYTTITYSGGTEKVWYQGIAGDGVIINLKQLNEKPLDPLTNGAYIYSVTNSYNEYEVLALYEGNVAYNPITSPQPSPLRGEGVASIFPQANAATTTLTPKIDGNYNGVFVKTTNYIIPLPSIITSETITPGSGIPLTTSITKSLVTTNGKNIPKTTISQISTGALVNLKLLVYTGSITNKSTNQQLINVMNIIQSTYSGSILSNTDKIGYILKQKIGEQLVKTTNNIFSLKVPVKKESVSDCQTNGQIIYGTVTGKESWLTCNSDIIVCGGSGSGYTIGACNVGSSVVGTGSSSFGSYFQFGRNTPYPTWTNGTAINNYDWKSPGGPNAGSANNWGVYEINKNTATYNNVSAANKIKMQGPCSSGYHVPTSKEWLGIYTILGFGQNGILMITDLKLPLAGGHYRSNSALYAVNNLGIYWSSSPNSAIGYYMIFSPTMINYHGNYFRSFGYSVRCFKN